MKKKVGTVIIIIFITSYLLVMFYEYKNKSSPVATISQAGMFITGLTLWVWMITDYFKKNRIKHRALWGWALIIFNILAAIIYFVYTNYIMDNETDC